MPPPHNDARNDIAACPVCGAPFTRTGRRRYRGGACRQAAWRRRTAGPPATQQPLPAAWTRRDGTICQCGKCEARYLGEQWCTDCSQPCRRTGPGGQCPCGELLTIDELINT